MSSPTEANETPPRLCGICGMAYLDPVVLPCLHLFCAACLDDRFGDALEIDCPSCGEVVGLPEPAARTASMSISLFPLAAFAGRARQWEELVARVDASEHMGSTCSSCEGSDVTSICGDCGCVLCDFCTEAHGRVAATRSHKVMGLGDLRAYDKSAIIPASLDCQEHKEVLRWWCQTCAKDGKGLKCAQCLTSHPAVFHACEDIALAAEREADEIISTAVRMVERTQSTLAALRQRLLNQSVISAAAAAACAGAAAATTTLSSVGDDSTSTASSSGVTRPLQSVLASPRAPLIKAMSTGSSLGLTLSPRESSSNVAGGSLASPLPARGHVRRASSSSLVAVGSINAEIDIFVDELEEELRRQRRVLHHQVYAAIEAARADEQNLDLLLRRAEEALAFASRARQESCPAEFLVVTPAIAARVAKLKERAHKLRHGFLGAPALLPDIDQFRLLKCANPVAERIATVLSCVDLNRGPESTSRETVIGTEYSEDSSVPGTPRGGGGGGGGAPATPPMRMLKREPAAVSSASGGFVTSQSQHSQREGMRLPPPQQQSTPGSGTVAGRSARSRGVLHMLVQSNMAAEPVTVADSPLRLTSPADSRLRSDSMATTAAAGGGGGGSGKFAEAADPPRKLSGALYPREAAMLTSGGSGGNVAAGLASGGGGGGSSGNLAELDAPQRKHSSSVFAREAAEEQAPGPGY